jgi:hypothetical protein
MSLITERATLADLARTPGKAESIGGRIVQYMAVGARPNEVAGNIYVSSRAYATQVGEGKAFNEVELAWDALAVVADGVKSPRRLLAQAG